MVRTLFCRAGCPYQSVVVLLGYLGGLYCAVSLDSADDVHAALRLAAQTLALEIVEGLAYYGSVALYSLYSSRIGDDVGVDIAHCGKGGHGEPLVGSVVQDDVAGE